MRGNRTVPEQISCSWNLSSTTKGKRSASSSVAPNRAQASEVEPNPSSRMASKSLMFGNGVAANRRLQGKLFVIPCASNPLDEAIHHLLAAGLVEIDRQLIAVDLRDMAIAEFLMKHARADLQPRALHGAGGDERAVDGDRLPRPRVRGCSGALAVGARPLPAGRFVETAGEQILRRVKAALSVARMTAAVLGHLDVVHGEFVDEAGGDSLLPHA